jgi:hypothetical protein
MINYTIHICLEMVCYQGGNLSFDLTVEDFLKNQATCHIIVFNYTHNMFRYFTIFPFKFCPKYFSSVI